MVINFNKDYRMIFIILYMWFKKIRASLYIKTRLKKAMNMKEGRK